MEVIFEVSFAEIYHGCPGAMVYGTERDHQRNGTVGRGKKSTKFFVPRRLVTGFVLFVVSLVSIASYLFLKNSKNKLRQDELNFFRPSKPEQAEKTGIVNGTETERYPVVLKSHKPRLGLVLGALGFGVAGQFMLQTEKLLLIGALFVFRCHHS